ISSAYLLNLATLVLIFGTFAASVNLLGGFAGMVTLGQAGTFAAAGYAVAYMSTHGHGGSLEQILAGLVIAFLVSAVFGAMAVRTSGVYFLIVTLAQGMIIWGLAYSLSNITGGENGLPNVSRPAV